MYKILKNTRAVEEYYNKYYLTEHKKYLTEKRAKMEVLALIRWLKRIPQAVCDVGCGDGRHLGAFKKFGVKKGFGFDNSFRLIKKAKKFFAGDKNFFVKKMNFSKWRPKNEEFDITYSLFSSFSYCLDNFSAQNLINKMVKATKISGLICVDVDNPERLKKFLAGKIKGKMNVDEKLYYDEKEKILFAEEIKDNVALKTRVRYFDASELLKMFVSTGINKKDIFFKGGFNNKPFSRHSKRLIILVKKAEGF